MKKSLQHFFIRGFTLVEVTLALGICSFCLITLVALLPSGLTATANASRQTAATNIATSILADLQSAGVESYTPPSGPAFMRLRQPTPLYELNLGSTQTVFNVVPVTTDDPFGDDWVAVTTGRAHYRATVRISPNPSSSAGPYTFVVTVQWPGGLSSGDSTVVKNGSVTMVGRSSTLFN